MKNFGWNKHTLIGFALYLGIGCLTFVIDLAVIYALQYVHVYYPVAVGAGFIVAALANYLINRKYIFTQTTQSNEVALLWFFGIAFVWLWVTVGGTVFLVETVHVPLYISRIVMGMFVAIAGYILNALFTFKIRKHS